MSIFTNRITTIMMKATEQTNQQIERVIRKIAQKFPQNDETSMLTDIHIRVAQETGELMVYDDDDQEITRCIVEQWIDNKDDNFYDSVTLILRASLKRDHELIDRLGIMKPFSFVLEDDDNESIAELYMADDDTVIIGGDLMKDLDQDLDHFLDDLLKKD